MAYNFTLSTRGGLAGHLSNYAHHLFVDPEVSWTTPTIDYPEFTVNVANVINHPWQYAASAFWIPLWLYIVFGGVISFVGFFYLVLYHCRCFGRCWSKEKQWSTITYWIFSAVAMAMVATGIVLLFIGGFTRMGTSNLWLYMFLGSLFIVLGGTWIFAVMIGAAFWLPESKKEKEKEWTTAHKIMCIVAMSAVITGIVLLFVGGFTKIGSSLLWLYLLLGSLFVALGGLWIFVMMMKWMGRPEEWTRTKMMTEWSKSKKIIYAITIVSLGMFIASGTALQYAYNAQFQSDFNSLLSSGDHLRTYADGIRTRVHTINPQFAPEFEIVSALVVHCQSDGCPSATTNKLISSKRNIDQTGKTSQEVTLRVDDKIGYDTAQFSGPIRYWINQGIVWNWTSISALFVFTALTLFASFYFTAPKTWLQAICVWLVLVIYIADFTFVVLPFHGTAVMSGDVCIQNPYTVGYQVGGSQVDYVQDYVECTPGDLNSNVNARLVQARTDLSLAVEASEDLLAFENARKGTGSTIAIEGERETARINSTLLQVKINTTIAALNETNTYLLCDTSHNMVVDILDRICYGSSIMKDSIILAICKYITLMSTIVLIWLMPQESWESIVGTKKEDTAESTPLLNVNETNPTPPPASKNNNNRKLFSLLRS